MSFSRIGSVCLLVIALAACDNLSDVGNQSTLAPTAIIDAVGYTVTNDDGNNVTLDVRSQSEVLLSGRNSLDPDKPIVSYLWELANEPQCHAVLTVRNISSINVTIPRTVAAGTECLLNLTVTDSDGDADTATATLRVEPALDDDRFLEYVNNKAKLKVVVATKAPLPAGGSFDLSAIYRVTYPTRNGQRKTLEFPLGTAGLTLQPEDLDPDLRQTGCKPDTRSQPVRASWSSELGSGGDDPTDFRNPVFTYFLPRFNADDIIRCLQNAFPDEFSNTLDPALVDTATIEIIFTLESPGDPTLQSHSVLYVRDGLSNTVKRAANDGTGPTVLTLSDTDVEGLRLSGGGLENRGTAATYYAVIDPEIRKTTLYDWLDENCFDRTQADLGADAHATYVNNFDLGFGRDMYMLKPQAAACRPRADGTGRQPATLAAVVFNNPTLEAAAKKIDPVLAVAMEYYPDADPNRPGLVTFYAFAPDEDSQTGNYQRVGSANFDGRGEKPLPGSCTTCHGGRPRNPVAADVGATFLPFDLESFLYGDTDPAFPPDAKNAILRSQLTRQMQGAEFRKLNLAVLSTFGQGAPGSAEFQCFTELAGPCELVATWYGDSGTDRNGRSLPSATFLNEQITPGWKNTPGEEIYHTVFARNCRACHTQRVRDPSGAVADPTFRTYAEFAEPVNFSAIRSLALQQGAMPGSRLTQDRLWQPLGDGQIPGDLLAAHLTANGSDSTGLRPGAPIACLQGLSIVPAQRNDIPLVRDNGIPLSADCSDFAENFAWSVTRRNPGTGAVQSGGATLVNNNQANTGLVVNQPGDIDVTLIIAGPGGATASVTGYGNVPDLIPDAQDLTATIGLSTPENSAPLDVDVLGQAVNKGDEQTTVRVTAVPPGLTTNCSPDCPGGVMTITATSLAGGDIAYTLVDRDGESVPPNPLSSGKVSVTVSASIAANDLTVNVDANSQNTPINLSALVVDLGQPIIVTVTQAPSLRGLPDPNSTAPFVFGRALGSLGSVTDPAACDSPMSDVCIRYSTPPQAASVVSTISVGNDDQVAYRACFADQPNVCDDGTLTIRINGTHPFSAVRAILTGPSCATGCHLAAQPGSVWDLVGVDSTNDSAVRCRIRQLSIDDDVSFIRNDADQSLVNLLAPESSLLYNKPRDVPVLQGHGGGAVSLTPQEQDAILGWIQEGGYNTSGTNQACPP